MRSECLLTLVMLLARASVDTGTTTAAPNLFKCVGGRGEVSFQSTPCAADARTAWARTVTPAPMRSPAPGKSAGTRAPSPARLPSGEADSRRSKPSACDAAKLHRADLRERQWRTITFDQLRGLDDDVARACRRQ